MIYNHCRTPVACITTGRLQIMYHYRYIILFYHTWLKTIISNFLYIKHDQWNALILLKVKNSNNKKKKQGNIKRPAHMAINSAGLSCSSVQSAEREAPPAPNKMTSNRLQVRIRDVAKTAWGWHVGLMAFSWTMVLNHHPYSHHRKKKQF